MINFEQIKTKIYGLFSSPKPLIEPIFEMPESAQSEAEMKAYIDQYVADSIAYQEQEFEIWKAKNIVTPLHDRAKIKHRRKIVLYSAITSLLIIFLLMLLGYIPYPPVFSPSNNKPTSPVFFSFISLLIGAPIAYAVWTIRDENMAQQIENARKDTNLKDFQRLSEWASGFHLPEDKTITTNKKITKPVEQGIEETVEVTTASESFNPPKENQQISRRVGAESLQLAAIYQIQDFMRGMYGEQFMKPAFHLLHSIWEGLISPLLPQENEITDFQINQTRQLLLHAHKQPIYKAVNRALVGDQGMILRFFRQELNGLFLAGVSTSYAGLKPLNLAGLDLQKTNLQWSNLEKMKAQAVDFHESTLQYAIFSETEFQKTKFTCSTLFKINLEFCHLHFSDLSGCNLIKSELHQANLAGADLTHNADLTKSNLEYADIDYANFSDADLSECNLDCVSFSEVKISDTTQINNETKKYWLRKGAKEFDFLENLITRKET